MSAMPRKRQLAVKASSVAMGQELPSGSFAYDVDPRRVRYGVLRCRSGHFGKKYAASSKLHGPSKVGMTVGGLAPGASVQPLPHRGKFEAVWRWNWRTGTCRTPICIDSDHAVGGHQPS